MLSGIVAAGIVIAQGVVVWALLRFARDFGAYTTAQRDLTQAMLTIHETNFLVSQRILEELREFRKASLKEVA